MRPALTLAFVLGCGGPSHQQLVETPTATTRPVATEAPPASTSDKDRERLIQQFDDMQSTQQAYREANQEMKAPPKAVKGGEPPKKAPVEQAPPEPDSELMPKK